MQLIVVSIFFCLFYIRIIIVEKFTLQHQKQHTMRIKSIPRNAATIAMMNSVFNKSTCKEGCSSISHKVGRRKSQLTVSTPLSTNTYKNNESNKRQVSEKKNYVCISIIIPNIWIDLFNDFVFLPCNDLLGHLNLIPIPCHNISNLPVLLPNIVSKSGTSTSS